MDEEIRKSLEAYKESRDEEMFGPDVIPPKVRKAAEARMLKAVSGAARRKAKSAETAEDMEALAAISLACRNLNIRDPRLFSLTMKAMTSFAEKAETVDDMNAILHLSNHYPQW